MKQPSAKNVVVVGGGLVGSLLSILLARRGSDVRLLERRGDMRSSTAESGRSINLVLTTRGIRGLELAGLEERAARITIPVMGRMMHTIDGELSYQPYGKDGSECNHSISRAGLNRLLLSEAESCGVRIEFEKKVCGADLERGKLFLADGSEVEAPVIFGADGGGSAVRRVLVGLDGFEESIQPLGHGYKELLIPPDEDGAFRIEKNALHIWPRGDLMLMALPNLDGSFTVTLYLPEVGPSSFREVNSTERVRDLFTEQFPDSIPLIPDFEASYLDNPIGNLGTVRCRPWHFRDRLLLIGDAAHAVVPFFGQGMNCGFEDCVVLDALLETHGDDWERAFAEFTPSRKPQADAIADMAVENFVEMRDKVGDPGFLLRKEVEHRLEQTMPREYRSRYSMVMYSSIPYRRALEAGLIQQEILDDLCDGLASAADLDLDLARRRIREKLTPFLDRHSIDLSY